MKEQKEDILKPNSFTNKALVSGFSILYNLQKEIGFTALKRSDLGAKELESIQTSVWDSKEKKKAIEKRLQG